MAANNGFPGLTTVGQGLFAGASAIGLIQGHAFPDPATRNALRSGIVSQAETVAMYGGIAVNADISPISSTGPRHSLGQVLVRSTSLTTLSGFTVSDQAYNMVNDPANQVPTSGSGQSINYYPLGSRARIALACSPNLINLRGGAINQQVSWDFTANVLIPYSAPYAQTNITGATWANTAGGQIDFVVASDLTADINAGDWIETAGVISTGGTGGSYNGAWQVVSISATDIIVAAPAAVGFFGTYSSAGHVNAGGGALAVTVLDIQPAGCMTVDLTNGYNWNYNGACAIVQLTGGTVA